MRTRWIPHALALLGVCATSVALGAGPASAAPLDPAPPRVFTSVRVICSNGLAYLMQYARNLDTEPVNVRFESTPITSASDSLRLPPGQVRYLLRPTGTSDLKSGSVYISISKLVRGQRVPGDDIQGYLGQDCTR